MQSAQVHVVDFLCFAVENHTYRIKYYVLRKNVVAQAFELLKCRSKHVQLAALRFVATCIKRNENFYNRWVRLFPLQFFSVLVLADFTHIHTHTRITVP